MNFANHETHYEYCKKTITNMPLSCSEFYDRTIKEYALRNSGKVISNNAGCFSVYDDDQVKQQALIAENIWYLQHRPYYKVWPAIINSLTNLKLDYCLGERKWKLRALAIRFPCNDYITSGTKTQAVKSILVSPVFHKSYHNANEVFLSLQLMPTVTDRLTGEILWDGSNVVSFPIDKRVTIEESIENSKNIFGDDTEAIEVITFCIRVSVMIHLLEDDPSIIQPDVLAADRNRFDRSTDPEERQKLIDKAKRRGIVGWRIGEQYESMPHFRRPHFGLRHTGKGGSVPRIVPIKGAIVHRQKMTDVPTGYLAEDGTEIE